MPDYQQQAYIFYGMAISLKANVPLSSIGFSFSGKAKAQISIYKVHDREKSLLSSVSDDLRNFPSIFNPKDIKSLNTGEACTLSFAGELKSSLDVSWSDLYTGSLFGASKFIKSASTLAIEVDAGASVEFGIGIRDEFSLVIKRINDNKFEVGIKKNKRRSIDAGASIGISAQFADNSKEIIEDLLNDLLKQILKKGKTEIDKLLEKTSVDELAEKNLPIIDEVAKLLGLPSPTGKLEEYKEKWEAFVEDIKTRIEAYIKAKVEAGVRFEYSQLKTESNLLVGEFTEKAMEDYHHDLIKLKVDKLVKIQNGLKIKKYLQENSYKRESGFGFNLKIAKAGLGVDHEASIELVERINEKGQKHIVSKSEKAFNGKFFGEKFEWSANLLVETEGFIDSPKIIDLNSTLNLGFEWKENKKLEKGEINRISDIAMLWGLINNTGKRDVLREELTEKLRTKDATDIRVSLQLEVPADMLRQIIHELYNLKKNKLASYQSILAQSLAASMYDKKDSLIDRIEEHGNIFLFYLQNGNQYRDHPTIRQYSSFISENHIKSIEKSFDILINQQGEQYSAIKVKEIIRGFNKFHNNIYRVRLLGYWMSYFARIIRREEELDSSLQIKYKLGGESKIINIVRQEVEYGSFEINPEYAFIKKPDGDRFKEKGDIGTELASTATFTGHLYLDTNDLQKAKIIFNFYKLFAESLGIEFLNDGKFINGSWFKRNIIMRFRLIAQSDEAKEVFEKGKKALELAHLNKVQSEINSNNLKAAGSFLKSVEHIPNISTIIGNLVIIKITNGDESQLMISNLTMSQVIQLEKHPELYNKPSDLYNMLIKQKSD